MPAIWLAALSLWLILPAQSPGAEAEIPAPARATRIKLDFRDQRIGQIAGELERRSGYTISMDSPSDPRWNARSITLEAPEPVPFWEALDRYCEAARLNRYLQAMRQPLTVPTRDFRLTHQGIPAEPTATRYVGAFRLGPLTLVEQGIVRYAGGSGAPTTPGRPAGPRPDGGAGAAAGRSPTHVELLITPEPGRLCLQVGPIRDLVAEDDRGQTLLSGQVAKEGVPPLNPTLDLGDAGTLLQIPLAIPEAPGRVIRRLAGKIPMELACRTAGEPEVIPLAGAEGRTVDLGGATMTVDDVEIKDGASAQLALTFKLDPPPAAGRSMSDTFVRLMAYANLAVESVDGREQRIQGSIPRTSASGDGIKLTMTYHARNNAGIPTELRAYRMERATWDLPFEFRDVPLPGPAGDEEAAR